MCVSLSICTEQRRAIQATLSTKCLADIARANRQNYKYLLLYCIYSRNEAKKLICRLSFFWQPQENGKNLTLPQRYRSAYKQQIQQFFPPLNSMPCCCWLISRNSYALLRFCNFTPAQIFLILYFLLYTKHRIRFSCTHCSSSGGSNNAFHYICSIRRGSVSVSIIIA